MLCWVSAAVVVTWYCFGIEAAAIVLGSSDCFLCLFLCLFGFFLPEGWPANHVRPYDSRCTSLCRFFFFFFFEFPFSLCKICFAAADLWNSATWCLSPLKQVTVVWLERPHAFLQLRILAYSRRKQPLKTMKEWVRQWRRQTEKIKAFRVKTLYQHSRDE